jgi:hypothetical protein
MAGLELYATPATTTTHAFCWVALLCGHISKLFLILLLQGGDYRYLNHGVASRFSTCEWLALQARCHEGLLNAIEASVHS